MTENNSIGLLTKCPLERTTKFLHSMIDKLCQRSHSQYNDFKDYWDLEQWWQVCDSSQHFFKEAGRNSWQKDEILQKLSNLPSDYQQEILDVFFARKQDIRTGLQQSTDRISKNTLQDFDWQMKLTLSSDKLANVQEPLTTVDFTIQGENETQKVSVELDKDELKKMISSLEAANKAVQQLKT